MSKQKRNKEKKKYTENRFENTETDIDERKSKMFIAF